MFIKITLTMEVSAVGQILKKFFDKSKNMLKKHHIKKLAATGV
jgi:hypothetical protein